MYIVRPTYNLTCGRKLGCLWSGQRLTVVMHRELTSSTQFILVARGRRSATLFDPAFARSRSGLGRLPLARDPKRLGWVAQGRHLSARFATAYSPNGWP